MLRRQIEPDAFHYHCERLLFVAVLVISPALAAQSRPPVFDVASIRVNTTGGLQKTVTDAPTPAGARGVITPRGNRWEARNATLRTLVRFAYGSDGDPATPALLDDSLVLGGPSWIDSDAFDIVATMPETENRAVGDSALMLRALLAERFALKAHTETRVLPVYELVRSRPDGTRGPQLRTSSGECAQQPARVTREQTPCGVRGAFQGFVATGASMTQLAAVLSPLLGRTVIDRTALYATFDFNLRFTDDPTSDSGFPSLFTALDEQLGLKLESTRAPGTVVVIDRVRRPTKN